MVEEVFSRNIGAITGMEQGKLAKATVGIVGLGGIGSPAFEILVRIGVGRFIIFDKDRFEKTNFNRQLYAAAGTLGRWKTDVAAEKAVGINPDVVIEKHAAELDENAVSGLKKCDVVVDGTDNIAARRIIAKFCRKNKVPYVFCSAIGSMGMVSVFNIAGFEKIFGKMKEPGRKSIVAPAAIMAGTLSASQAIKIILKKKFVKAPEFIFFDLFSERTLWKQKI